MFEKANGPSFNGFWHQCMIGVRTGSLCHLPGGVPFQSFDIDQQTHQLSDGQRGMSVIQLNGHLVGEITEIIARRGGRAEFRVLVTSDDIRESGSDQKVFLFQTQFFALHVLIRRTFVSCDEAKNSVHEHYHWDRELE
jgi:hypothetical protein